MNKPAHLFLVLACSLSLQGHAKDFPVLLNYVVQGVSLSDSGLPYKTMVQKFGQPVRVDTLTNECNDITTSYFYYPNVVFSGDRQHVGVDKVFFKPSSTDVIHFKGFDINAKTSLKQVKGLGASFVEKKMGYRVTL